MAGWGAGSVRRLRTRSLSFTSHSSARKSASRERSRSPMRTEVGQGWQRLKAAVSCKERLLELRHEQEAWQEGQRNASPEPMPRTASPSPERWVHAQCVMPNPVQTSAALAETDNWPFLGGCVNEVLPTSLGVPAMLPLEHFGMHWWEQHQAWDQAVLHQEVQSVEFTPLQEPTAFCDLTEADPDFESRFGELADLVQNRAKAAVVDEILAELQLSGPAEQQNLILWLAPSAAELSLTSSGTRLVQEALDLARGSTWKQLIEQLLPRAVELSKSRHGNFALQKLAVRMNTSEVAGLVDALYGHIQEIVQQTYGCRSFERLIEHFSDPELTPILDELTSNARELAVHKHANYAISAILEHGRPERQKQVIDALIPDATVLAMNRVATHVLDRVLACGEEVQSRCVDSWLNCSTNIAVMAANKFGSFLLADFAKMCSADSHARIRCALAAGLPLLKKTDEGRRVVEAYALS